jgi:hypothetical protein
MVHEFCQPPHPGFDDIHANPPLPRLPAASALFGAAMVIAISNIKIISFRSVFIELNAIVVAAKRPWTAQ